MKLTLAAVAAMIIIPGIAMAQQDTTTRQDTSRQNMTTDTSRGAVSDTGMKGQQGQQGVTTDTSRGAVSGHMAPNMGLTTDQVKQLQTALDSAGCKVNADGQFGRSTDRAVHCFQRKESISGRNLNEVLRKLNLGFTASDSTMPRMGRKSGGMQQDTSAMHHDTSSSVRRP